MKDKKISFFLGAGAEITYGMPAGASFKKETILCKNAINFMENFNSTADNIEYLKNTTSGKFIRHNSSNILYQSYKEIDEKNRKEFLECFTEDEILIIENYDKYRRGLIKEPEVKKEVTKKFAALYKTKIYNPIKNTQDSNEELSSETNKLLEKLSFYSTLDSDFNYLRLPNIYKKECCNVMKLYYSAYLSILEAIINKEYYQKLISSNASIDKNEYYNEYKKGIKSVINEHNGTTYYDIMKKYIASIDAIITTNYTYIIDEILSEEKCFHIHGTMEEFEGLETKNVYKLTEIPNNEIVFPYILIQSGVKPIINQKEIETFFRAFNKLKDANIIIVLEYSFSSDDEHVITVFKELLKDNARRIYYFNYVEKAKDKIEEHKAKKSDLKNIFKNDSEKINVIDFSRIDDFEKELLDIIYSN